MKTRQKISVIILALFMFQTLQDARAAFAADPPYDFKPYTSGSNQDYPMEDSPPDSVPPNVLFYIDISGNATVSMKGVAPADQTGSLKSFYQNFPEYMEDANNRIEMAKYNTFGLGARPISGGTPGAQSARLAEAGKVFEPGHVPFAAGIDLGAEQNIDPNNPRPLLYERWGRDTIESNDIIGDPNCYYSLDPNKPYMLTFRHLDANGHPVKPNYLDAIYSSNPDIYDNPNYFDDYEELMTYMPGRGKAGKPVPLKLANKYLVPNDSKMYQMKLVLSKILAPTPENMKMHSRMRLGLASTFAESRFGISGTIMMEPYKNTTPSDKPPYFGGGINQTTPPVNYRRVNGEDLFLLRHKKANNRPVGAKTYDRNGGTENFNGNVFTWPDSVQGVDLYTNEDGLTHKWFHVPDESHTFTTIGLYRPFNLTDSQPFRGVNYVFVSNASAFTTTAVENGAPPPSSGLNPFFLRSIMHVPFDFMYTKSGDLYAPSPSLVTLREYIDGVDQFTAPTFNGRVSDQNKIHTNIEFTTSMIPGGIEDLIYDTAVPDGSGGNWRRSSVYPVGPKGEIKYDLDGIAETIFNFNDPKYGSSSNTRGWRHNRFQRVRNSEGLMTGTVAGTVLNFFSPANKEADWSYTTPERSINSYPDNGGPAQPGKEKTVYHYQAGVDWSEGNADGTGDTRGYFPINNSCQGNYVIYFSTGNEFNAGWDASITKRGERNMTQSILNMVYDSTKEMRGRRKDEDGKWIPAKLSLDSPLQVIVVGLIDSEGAEGDGDPYLESSVQNQDPVRRARNAMRRMAHAGQPSVERDENGAPLWDTMKPNDTKDALGNYKVTPIFADDVPSLLHALNNILIKVSEGRTSGGAPRVVQSAATIDDGDVTYFSNSYKGDPLRQWDSIFYRSTIPSGLRQARRDWEAGAMMKTEAEAGARGGKVFAVLNGVPTPLGSAQGSFNSAIGMSTQTPQGDLFRKWLIDYKTTAKVNGLDLVVRDNGVLGSMEHSSPALVPKDEPKSVFVQTNRGVLHALDYGTGVEKWAFIPPPTLQHLMWRQKFSTHPADGTDAWAASWMNGDGENAPTSQQVMLLDGQISVSEAYDERQILQHYLFGALGRAGNGLYAMNVSREANGEAAAPNFMWAVDNNRYSNADTAKVYAWGNAAAIDMSGWADLGLTIVAPEVRRTLSDGYVGIIPGGLPPDLGKNGGTQGRALFVFDHLTGRVVRKITNSNLGMMISPVYYITKNPEESGAWVTSEFFTGDSNGNVLYCDAEQSVNAWNLKSIFRVADGSGNGILTPYAYALVKFPGENRWLFGGTGDIIGPEQDMVEVEGVRSYVQRGLYNSAQYIYGLKLDTMNIKTSTAPYGLADLWSLAYYGTKEGAAPQQDMSADPKKGWYLKLAGANPGSDTVEPTKAEYVSAAPYFNETDGYLYVATFTEYARQVQTPGNCGSTGFSRLYALNPQTGNTKWDDGTTQSKVFGNIKIMGITSVYREVNGQMVDTVILATSSPDGLENNDDMVREEAYAIDDTTMGIDSIAAARGLPNLPPKVPNLQYWREMFR